jgi:hypothetical protein
MGTGLSALKGTGFSGFGLERVRRAVFFFLDLVEALCCAAVVVSKAAQVRLN